MESAQELNVGKAQIRTLFDRQKKQHFVDCQAEIEKHEFQASYDRRSVQKLSENVESKEEECHCVQAEVLQRRDQQLLHAQTSQQKSELRKVQRKSLNEMEELKKLQSFTFDSIARRRWVEDRDTILVFIGKIQELQNESNCMNDSRDFHVRMLNHSAVEIPTLPVKPCLLTSILGGMLSRTLGMPRRKEGSPSILDTWHIGNFANPTASSSAHYAQESNPWISNVFEHTSPHVMSENQNTSSGSEMPV